VSARRGRSVGYYRHHWVDGLSTRYDGRIPARRDRRCGSVQRQKDAATPIGYHEAVQKRSQFYPAHPGSLHQSF